MNVKPLGDRVLVQPIEQEEVKKGGIIIPDTAKEKPQEGKIIAVGAGKHDDNGKVIPLNVKKGDRRFIISDFDFGGNGRMNGLQLLESVKKIDPNIPFVVLSAQDNLKIAMDTLRQGALDYFIKGQESTYTTVLTSMLKTNEIVRLKKDRKDFATLGVVGLILFSLLLVLSFFVASAAPWSYPTPSSFPATSARHQMPWATVSLVL